MNALQDLAAALRERTWLSPVSADEMNQRDRWLADQLEAALLTRRDQPRELTDFPEHTADGSLPPTYATRRDQPEPPRGRYDMNAPKREGAELLAFLDIAHDELSALCKGKRFRMSVPVQKDDSDMILGDALRDAKAYIVKLEAAASRRDQPEKDEPYFVEVDSNGCERCNSGKTWTVVGPDGSAASQSWEHEEDAETFADAMNAAYWMGKGTRRDAPQEQNEEKNHTRVDSVPEGEHGDLPRPATE